MRSSCTYILYRYQNRAELDAIFKAVKKLQNFSYMQKKLQAENLY